MSEGGMSYFSLFARLSAGFAGAWFDADPVLGHVALQQLGVGHLVKVQGPLHTCNIAANTLPIQCSNDEKILHVIEMRLGCVCVCVRARVCMCMCACMCACMCVHANVCMCVHTSIM